MTALRATVRLQLHADFDFDAARREVDYYAELGVSHYYLSPFLASRRGSPHGYDGIDPGRIDPELGGEAGLAALVEALRARGMGIIADIVPNHLAVSQENPWWQDVLARGQASEFARCFDIDWQQPGADGKLLLPFLGERYREALDSGQLTLAWQRDSGRFTIAYFDNRFPIDPDHTTDLLAGSVPTAGADATLPAIAEVLAAHDVKTRAGRQRLHALLERQAYRLAHWRSGNDALNWRRFFDITELAGVRVEDASVFDLAHAGILEAVERGGIDGLRIDHIDGLADPKAYCLRLQARLAMIAERQGAAQPIPIYVEKILGEGERLHDDWGVAGTTGYEFLDLVSGVQHDPRGEPAWRQLWEVISGRRADFAAEVQAARGEMLEGPLTAEFERCVGAIETLARRHLEARELTPTVIRRVLGALATVYPVYRSYADARGRPQADVDAFETALRAARDELSAADAEWLAVFERWLGGEAPARFEEPERHLRLRAIACFQQLTSPLAAKAVEDTAGYRSAVLLSRNDVGCEGAHFAYWPQSLHTANQQRLTSFPHGLLATATHDHKRGEDVRARLASMSELSAELVPMLQAWSRDSRLFEEDARPSGGDRLMLLQLLLAAWPLGLAPHDRQGLDVFAERLIAWQQKAMREAKLESHWLAPNDAYEQSGAEAIRCALAGGDITAELAAASALLDLPGAVNGLAQCTLKLCSPGVPDLYQGTEFWDQSLVDPDNRRRVDIRARREALAQDAWPALAWQRWRDGAVKQALIRRLLGLRKRHPALFAQGSYEALAASGALAEHVIAFARRVESVTLVVAVPRLPGNMLDAGGRLDWKDTSLDLSGLALTGTGQGVLSADSVEGSALPLAAHLADFPCGAWVWHA